MLRTSQRALEAHQVDQCFGDVADVTLQPVCALDIQACMAAVGAQGDGPVAVDV